MSETVFDLILAKKIPSWVVWQDDNFVAFLTPFPNTPGLTVVIPRTNQGDYIFNLSDDKVKDLILASKKVAKIMERAFSVTRVAMVVEGTGVPYVHVKLYPLHGDLGAKTDIASSHKEFYPVYVGFLSTAEGPKMSDEELTKIQKQIITAAEYES